MIYVVSGGGDVTGGPETLHQLVSLLLSMGQEARMYYVRPHTLEVPERYRSYHVEAADRIEDSPENILIVPETMTYALKGYRKIRICIWWLSVDYYFSTTNVAHTLQSMKKRGWPKILFPVAYLAKAVRGNLYTYRYHFEDHGKYLQLYNCEYAHRFLLEHGVPEERTLYLCGPLNQSFFERAEKLKKEDRGERKNWILYNPAKGREFTEKIIAAAEKEHLNGEFVPLKGMTPEQVSEKMAQAKVYMDFGFFPGPERIPREAVTMGCNIITSRRGSAANEVDVPIPDKMKIEDKDENIPRILDRLRDMLDHYDQYVPYYDSYREKVEKQVPLLRENAEILLEKA